MIIAGADGYIGRRLQNKLAGNGELLLLSPVRQENYIHFDLLQLSQFDFRLVNHSDIVIFLAGISSPDICNDRYQYAYDVNVMGTIAFIKNCLVKGARVLFFSSDTVYGNSQDENHEDIFPSDPSGEYGKMKLSVEKYFRGEAGFKSFRLSYVFSWEDKFTSYLRNCQEHGRDAEVFDPLIRKAVYIEDLMTCIVNISREWENFSNQAFNICGPQYLSRLEIANYFSESIGKIGLNVVRPGRSFYEARPEKIHISTKYSESLLEKRFTPIRDALRMESHLFQHQQ